MASGDDELMSVVNINIYCLLVEKDLRYALYSLLSNRVNYRKQFYARSLAVELCEYLKSMSSLLDSSFWRILEKYVHDRSIIEKFKNKLAIMRTIRGRHGEFLRTIRNVCAAHRDTDSLKQLEVIECMNPERVARIAADVEGVHEAILSIWMDIMPRIIEDRL